MTDKPKTWGEMTPEEKGALLLAHHDGAEIQFLNATIVKEWITAVPKWTGFCAYRVKPEPKRETVRLSGRVVGDCDWVFGATQAPLDTHHIVFDTIDGEPDCSSIRMEKIE